MAKPLMVKIVICIPSTRCFKFEYNKPLACNIRPIISEIPDKWIISKLAWLYSKANKSINAIGIYSIAFDCAAMASFSFSLSPSPILIFLERLFFITFKDSDVMRNAEIEA